MNHDTCDTALSDSSSDDGEANTPASATENYALLGCQDEKSNDIILRRIAHYTEGGGAGSRFHRKFQDDDNEDICDDDHRQFNVSLRQSHKKPFTRYAFLFGFASTLIILSQLYLLFYYDDRSVQGEFFRSFVFILHFRRL